MKPIAHRAFPSPQALDTWLADNHAGAAELWVRIYKAGSGKPSVTWTDCVIEAIRYGWIDGQKKSLDEQSFLQRLSPRKPGSNWSSRNCAHAAKLIENGRMTPAGRVQVDAAKRDGRWDKAYAGSADMEIPKDFLKALNKLPRRRGSSPRSTGATCSRSITGCTPRRNPRRGQGAWPRSWRCSTAGRRSTDPLIVG